MPRPLDIACLQTRPRPDFRSALDEALPLADTAARAGADILFLPEYCGGLATEGAAVAPPSAPEEKHPFLQEMQGFARDRKVWVNLGSIAVDGPDGRIINRGFMLDDAGEIRGRYDKINMFDIQLSETEVYRESARVSPGSKAVIHDTPFARIGHTICYDLRFPELFRTLAQAGAEKKKAVAQAEHEAVEKTVSMFNAKYAGRDEELKAKESLYAAKESELKAGLRRLANAQSRCRYCSRSSGSVCQDASALGCRRVTYASTKRRSCNNAGRSAWHWSSCSRRNRLWMPSEPKPRLSGVPRSRMISAGRLAMSGRSSRPSRLCSCHWLSSEFAKRASARLWKPLTVPLRALSARWVRAAGSSRAGSRRDARSLGAPGTTRWCW